MCDVGAEMDWITNGKPRVALRLGDSLPTLLVSRILLETRIRDKLKQISNVEIRYNSRVTRFITNSTSSKGRPHIRGVEYEVVDWKTANSSDSSLEVNSNKEREQLRQMADLVVDCSGKSTANKKWFKDIGLDVKTDKISCYLTYVTYELELTEEQTKGKKVIYYQQYPPKHPFMSILQAAEGKKWVFTMATINKERVPRNVEDIIPWLQEHNMPEIVRKITNCKYLTTPHMYSKEGNEFSNFHQLKVDGYVAVGDCVANFNPAYGQGMSTAGDGVLLLDTTIRRGLTANWCSDFQIQLSRQLTPPFFLACFGDLRFPGTETEAYGMKTMLPIADFVFGKINDATTHNAYVYKGFVEVVNLGEGYLWTLLSGRFFWNLITDRTKQ